MVDQAGRSWRSDAAAQERARTFLTTPTREPLAPAEIFRNSFVPIAAWLFGVVAAMLLVPLLPGSLSAGQADLVGTLAFAVAVAGLAARLTTAVLVEALLVGAICAAMLVAGLLIGEFQPRVGDIALVGGALLLAPLLIRNVERLWWVVPLALLVAGLDVVSVFSEAGPSRQLLQQAERFEAEALPAGVTDPAAQADLVVDPETGAVIRREDATSTSGDDPAQQLVSTLLIQTPAYGRSDGPETGFVDFFFASMFLTIARLWGLGMRRNMVAVVCAFVVASLGTWAGVDFVPVIPLLAAAFLVANGRFLLDALRTV